MSEQDEGFVETPKVKERLSSLVFPTEIKYQTPDGQISSLYIKEGVVTFRYDTDEDGNNVGDFVQIVINVGESDKNIVMHTYPSFDSADKE